MTKDAWTDLHAAIDGIVEHRTKKLEAEIARLAKRVVELKAENKALREERISAATMPRSGILAATIPALVEQYKVTMDTPVEDVPWRDARIPSLIERALRLKAPPDYRICLYDVERAVDMDFLRVLDFGVSRLREARLYVRAVRAREAGADE